MVSQKIDLAGHGAALLAVLFWGTSFLFTKSLMANAGLSPLEMFVGRFSLSYLLVLAVTFREFRSDSLRDELVFLVSGICAGSLYFMTENYALQKTSAGNVSLLVNTAPLFTSLLMSLVYGKVLGRGMLLGSVIAMGGVVAIFAGGEEGLSFHPAGDMLALLAAVSWAVYTIVIEKLGGRYSALFMTRKLFFYGLVTILPILVFEEEGEGLVGMFSKSELWNLGSLLYLVLFCSVGAYFIWNVAIRRVGALVANNYVYLEAPVTVVCGALFFGEWINFWGFVGTVLVILGLVVSDKWGASREG